MQWILSPIKFVSFQFRVVELDPSAEPHAAFKLRPTTLSNAVGFGEWAIFGLILWGDDINHEDYLLKEEESLSSKRRFLRWE